MRIACSVKTLCFSLLHLLATSNFSSKTRRKNCPYILRVVLFGAWKKYKWSVPLFTISHENRPPELLPGIPHGWLMLMMVLMLLGRRGTLTRRWKPSRPVLLFCSSETGRERLDHSCEIHTIFTSLIKTKKSSSRRKINFFPSPVRKWMIERSTQNEKWKGCHIMVI